MSEQNQTQQRLNRFLSFLTHDPDNVSLVLDAIRLSIQLGDMETAEKLLDTKSYLCDSLHEYHALAGRHALIRGEFNKALDMLLRSLGSEDHQPETWLDLAHTYHYLNKPQAAIEVLEQNAGTLEEQYPALFFTLYSRLLYLTDNSDKAIAQLETFHSRHEANAESAGLLSLILFEEDESAEQALHFANLALSKNPNAIEALIARTSIHLSNGQYLYATADVSRAVQHHPHSGRAWSSMAQLEFSQLRFQNAKDAAIKAITYMKDHIGTWHLLGWSHLMLNEISEALEAFQHSYDLDRGFAETHGGLAAAYAHLGQDKEAERHIKLAEKLGPDSFAAIYAKTVLLRRNNKSEEANEIFTAMQSRYYPSLKTTPKELIEKRLLELANESNPQSLH